MKPEISEFSYGFALTNEVVGWSALKQAPIFPSLLEEGKKGGGYDVKFDQPGVPLFLQFKRSEWMTMRSAKQYRAIHNAGMHINVPFFRFELMQTTKSKQHELLIELDRPPNLVFYAAPRFHKLDQINAHWVSKRVSARTLFVAPHVIGYLPDDKEHAIAFDDSSAFFCSEAVRVPFLTAADLVETLTASIDAQPKRLLRETISESLTLARNVRVRAETALRLDDNLAQVVSVSSIVEPASKGPSELGPDQQMLRELADIAVRDLDAQLVVVQQS